MRLQYIDALKGFLIITVVIGHIIQQNFPESVNHQLFRIIYSFHMPMFMFLSDFVSYKPNQAIQFTSSIIRRFTQLMIPFLVWSFIISPLVSWNFDIIKLMEKLLYPDRELWFLWVLFLFMSLMYWYVRLQKNFDSINR
jgi:fucose 4-O-acetylase-like acetyltransferase